MSWPIDSKNCLPKMHILDNLEIFRLDMGQISSNLLKKIFGTWQHASLSTSIVFYCIFAWPCTEIKILRYAFRFLFYFFSHFPFLLFVSFCTLIDLPLCLLPIQKILKSITETGNNIYQMGKPREVPGNIAVRFHSNFWAFSWIFHVTSS